MCLCTLCADRFLRGVHRTPLFPQYCRSRQIGLPGRLPGRSWGEALRWWVDAVGQLPEGVRREVEWEQLAVPELGTPSGSAHLQAAVGWLAAPAPPGQPLAFWHLLHRPALFREVYRRHDRREPDVWLAAKARAGLPLPEPERVEPAVAADLGALFRTFTSAEGDCAVAAHRFPGGVYVSARLAAPPGHPPAGTGPPSRADFVYYPADGTVLLRSPWSAAERSREVLDCLAQAVLGAPATGGEPGFDLGRLKEGTFRPLADADDVESVRVKTLHLRYPGRAGRREIRLDTLASDTPEAVHEMLRAHAGPDAEDLQVSHAVLQVRLRLEGCSKTHLVRLWPDRCDAGRGPFRTRVLACLRGWGL